MTNEQLITELVDVLQELVIIFEDVRVPGEIDVFTLGPARRMLSLAANHKPDTWEVEHIGAMTTFCKKKAALEDFNSRAEKCGNIKEDWFDVDGLKPETVETIRIALTDKPDTLKALPAARQKALDWINEQYTKAVMSGVMDVPVWNTIRAALQSSPPKGIQYVYHAKQLLDGYEGNDRDVINAHGLLENAIAVNPESE